MLPVGADHEAFPSLAGWAGYGYCASHSRYFWGLRLHLVCTPAGLPITFALANPKVDERDVAIDMFDHDPSLLAGRAGQTIIADKGYASVRVRTKHSPTTASNSSAPPAATNDPAAAPISCAPCVRSSSR